MFHEDLARQLEDRFKLGDQPVIARRLYQKLERLVRVYGHAALAKVSDVAMLARSKRNPGNWFRMVVGERMELQGFTEQHNRQLDAGVNQLVEPIREKVCVSVPDLEAREAGYPTLRERAEQLRRDNFKERIRLKTLAAAENAR